MKSIFVVLLIIATAVLAKADQAADVAKAWKFDATNINIDPSTWNAQFKERMTKVGAGVGYASTLSLPLTHLAIFGIFLYGLVKLSWPLVGASCLALYGWRSGKKTFLAAGVAATYALAFGASIF